MIRINNLYVFGTIVNITFKANKDAEQEILQLLYELDDLCSIYKIDSDVSKLNNSSDFIKVNKHVFNIIKDSIYYSKLTDGYEDITIKPLKDALKQKLPITNLLPLVNYQKISLIEPNLVKLEKGMQIDLGSMVKGYASDLIVNILKKYDISDAIINLGGNVYVLGLNNHQLWQVGIQDPLKKANVSLGYLELSNKAIVTSGINERGKHIINPKTGETESDLLSITIIADQGIDAEGLSTGCFIMGLSCLERINNNHHLGAILIDKHKNIYLTNNLINKFILTNKKYHIRKEI